MKITQVNKCSQSTVISSHENSHFMLGFSKICTDRENVRAAKCGAVSPRVHWASEAMLMLKAKGSQGHLSIQGFTPGDQ